MRMRVSPSDVLIFLLSSIASATRKAKAIPAYGNEAWKSGVPRRLPSSPVARGRDPRRRRGKVRGLPAERTAASPSLFHAFGMGPPSPARGEGVGRQAAKQKPRRAAGLSRRRSTPQGLSGSPPPDGLLPAAARS